MGFGGAERVISILSKGFIEKGHTVTLGVFTDKFQGVVYNLDSSVKVEHIKSCGIRSISGYKNSLKNIEDFFKKSNTDIVLCFANTVCALVSTEQPTCPPL